MSTTKGRIAEVEAENAARRAANAALRAQVQALLGRIEEVKARLAKDSHNSRKPPSSDPLGHKRPRSQRWRTGKKPGGQSGHAGETLHLESTPDEIDEDELCGLSECGLPIDGVSWLTIEWSDDTEDRIGFCCDAHLWIAEEWAREMMEENARREAQEDK